MYYIRACRHIQGPVAKKQDKRIAETMARTWQVVTWKQHFKPMTMTIAMFPDGSKRTETTVTHPHGSKTVTVSVQEEMENVDLSKLVAPDLYW